MSQAAVALKLLLAHTWLSRARGLLMRPRLRAQFGLWLHPCRAIHTIGLSYPIAVFFLDRNNRVVSVRTTVAPNRFAWDPHAFSVVETLPILEKHRTRAIHQLERALLSYGKGVGGGGV